jgi:8-amino-7-oxononanoate synthase
MDLFDKCKAYDVVKNAKEQGLYPYFHALESKQDIEVTMEGEHKIMIGSNNYLGLTGDDRVIQAGIEALEEYGSGVSGSRFLNGTLRSHIALEEHLAKYIGKEACMTFSTGFQTNLGILSAIATRDDVIICDRENHASIYDGAKLSYAKMLRYHHNDMEDLERVLKSVGDQKGKLIVTDGVFSMSGDICKLPEIVKLAKTYGARILLDDAHSFGVLGPGGRGTAAHFGLEEEVDMTMGTFSKSLASLGGFLVADEEVIEYIKHKSRPFIFSAAITPANTACAKRALEIIEEEPERVQNLIDISKYMRNKLVSYGLDLLDPDSFTPIIPIYTGTQLRTLVACKMLYERGVYVNPVLPPASPEGECLIRTSYTATHTKELMDQAAKIICEVLSSIPENDEEIMVMLGEA